MSNSSLSSSAISVSFASNQFGNCLILLSCNKQTQNHIKNSISFKHNVKTNKNSNYMTLQHVSLSNSYENTCCMCLSLCTNNTNSLSCTWSLKSVILNTFAQSICNSLHAHNIIPSHALTSPYWSSLLTQTSAPTATL